jgi:hypothetical protein
MDRREGGNPCTDTTELHSRSALWVVTLSLKQPSDKLTQWAFCSNFSHQSPASRHCPGIVASEAKIARHRQPLQRKLEGLLNRQRPDLSFFGDAGFGDFSWRNDPSRAKCKI